MPVIIHVYFQKALHHVMVMRLSMLYAVNTLANLSNGKRGSSKKIRRMSPYATSKRVEVVTRKGPDEQNALQWTNGNFRILLRAQKVPNINI